MVDRHPPLTARERRAIAALGAATATLAWLAAGALGVLAKVGDLLIPLAPLAALLGAALALTRARRLVWIVSGAAIALFAIVALTPLAGRWLDTGALVRRDSLPARVSAVVVLSEGVTRDSLLSPGALDRLLSGLALMRDSLADTLVVSRPRRTDNGATTAPDQAWVRALVARPFTVLVADSVHTTRDEAVRTAALLGAAPARTPRVRIALVTQPAHTRRACAAFERVGFAVSCVPARERGVAIRDPASVRDRLEIFHQWLYERAALVEYRGRGWL